MPGHGFLTLKTVSMLRALTGLAVVTLAEQHVVVVGICMLVPYI